MAASFSSHGLASWSPSGRGVSTTSLAALISSTLLRESELTYLFPSYRCLSSTPPRRHQGRSEAVASPSCQLKHRLTGCYVSLRPITLTVIFSNRLLASSFVSLLGHAAIALGLAGHLLAAFSLALSQPSALEVLRTPQAFMRSVSLSASLVAPLSLAKYGRPVSSTRMLLVLPTLSLEVWVISVEVSRTSSCLMCMSRWSRIST